MWKNRLTIIIDINTSVQSQAISGLFGGECGHISLVVIAYVNKNEIPALNILHFMHIVIY